jgi:hypothetical protein
MSFGNIIADTDGGTVVLVPAGTRTLNGLTSPRLQEQSLQPASLSPGLTGLTYTITLPATIQ